MGCSPSDFMPIIQWILIIQIDNLWKSGSQLIQIYTYIYIHISSPQLIPCNKSGVHISSSGFMVGGIPSPLKNMNQLGKNYSQYLEKQSKCSKPTRFNWWDTWFQPPFLMGKTTKSTISLAIFNGFWYVYQRILFTFHCTTIRAWRPLTTRDPPATRDCPLGPAGSLGPISIWLPLFWKSNPRFPQRNEELWEPQMS